MSELNSKILTKSAIKKEHGKYWPITKWVLIILILFLIFYLGTIPVRGKLAKKNISQGDELLVKGKYIAAKLAYKKAEILAPGDAKARERQGLVSKSSQNILELQSLVREMRLSDRIAAFSKATAVPKSEIEAVRTARELIEAHEYQLAIIPAATATQMDKTYRDAWLYLGIANLKASTLTELDANVRADYRNKAKAALLEAKNLDPIYEPTLDLLNQIAK